MRKRFGFAIIAVGAVLILAALLLLLMNRSEDKMAGEKAEEIVKSIETVIAAQEESDVREESRQESSREEPVQEKKMTVVMLDGSGYIGYLEIPALELKLPVMDEWDYNRLQIAPCRQAGSVYTDDLVIAAHNYQSHFGRLKELGTGDTVTFTDMEGTVHTYEVRVIRTLQPDAVDEVIHSGYDLVLYTCTPGGATRVTVFCTRVEE